jgi:hypothetical protein
MWVELEVSEHARHGGPPVALTAHVRGASGLQSLILARCEPHPRRIDVDAQAVSRLHAAIDAQRARIQSLVAVGATLAPPRLRTQDLRSSAPKDLRNRRIAVGTTYAVSSHPWVDSFNT